MKHASIDFAEKATPQKAIETVLGHPLWRAEEIEEYKERVVVRAGKPWPLLVRVAVVLTYIAAFIPIVLPWLFVCTCLRWTLEKLMRSWGRYDERFRTIVFGIFKPFFSGIFDERRWVENIVSDKGGYMRDGKETAIPTAAQAAMSVVRNIYPTANFYVKFFGTDPILLATMPVGEKVETFYLLVWDENPDGSVTVVQPPLRP